MPSTSIPRERTSPTCVAANGPFSGSGVSTFFFVRSYAAIVNKASNQVGRVLDADLILLSGGRFERLAIDVGSLRRQERGAIADIGR